MSDAASGSSDGASPPAEAKCFGGQVLGGGCGRDFGGRGNLVLAREFRASAVQIESIAVIPFSSSGGNADTDYLSDGLTESLIASLAHVPDLKVKSRNSVFRYKGKDVDVQKIGKELTVDALLTGTCVTARGHATGQC